MKNFTIRFIYLFTLLLLFAIIIHAEQYRGITPLKSTRADVERLFGKPSPDNKLDFYVTYKFENESVSINYVTDYDINMCKGSGWMCHCGIPKDTVLEIDVSPKIKTKFSALKIEKSKLDKSVLPEDTNISYYRDYEAGIAYWVMEKEDIVSSIRYLRSAKECGEEYRKALGLE